MIHNQNPTPQDLPSCLNMGPYESYFRKLNYSPYEGDMVPVALEPITRPHVDGQVLRYNNFWGSIASLYVLEDVDPSIFWSNMVHLMKMQPSQTVMFKFTYMVPDFKSVLAQHKPPHSWIEEASLICCYYKNRLVGGLGA